MDSDVISRVSQAFSALGNPARLQILLLLMSSDMCVHDLTKALGLTQPTVSSHLKVLRDAHVVSARANGRERVYHVADDHIAHILRDAVAHATETHPTSERTPS